MLLKAVFIAFKDKVIPTLTPVKTLRSRLNAVGAEEQNKMDAHEYFEDEI